MRFAILAAVLVAGFALGAEPTLPCAPGEKECAFKALQAHPARKLEFWKSALARPLEQRIGAAPRELIEILALDNIAHGYPNKPHAAGLTPDFVADVRRAFAQIPAPVRKHLEGKLAGIYFVDDIGGTGFTDNIRDAQGKPVAGFIVLDPAVLKAHRANGWATWKDNTPFRARPGATLVAKIEEAAHDNRANAIQYILLHELAHVLSIGASVHPDWDQVPKDIKSTAGLDFFNLSWTVGEKGYQSNFDAGFAQRKEVVFYFGPKLDAAAMEATYEGLELTNFPTLYAATHPADDFAEAFANYVHVVMMGKPFEIRIERGGKAVRTYRACWEERRCAAKRAYLESFLGVR